SKPDLAFVHEHAHFPGEITVPVGEEANVLGVLLGLPRIHHERVVDGDTDDLVDAERLEHGSELIETRDVSVRTGRCERSWKREHDDLLARKELAGIDGA